MRIIGGRRSWGHHGECRARAYNGGLGAEPSAGSRGRVPGQGVTGAKRRPPEAESILVIGCPTANLAPFRKCLALQRMSGLTVDLSALRKTSANIIETQFRQYHVTKVGGSSYRRAP